jgi:hypothetical protein
MMQVAAAEENAVSLAATRKLRAAERRISPESTVGIPQPRRRSRSIGRAKQAPVGAALKDKVTELEEENRSLWRLLQEVAKAFKN